MKTEIFSSGINNVFPFSLEKGAECLGINHQKMRLIAESGIQLQKDEVANIIKDHHQFLASGGACGKWKSLQVNDIVVGFFDCEFEGEGEQATFERMNLTKVSFQKFEFPFANFCGVFAVKNDFKESNLSYSLFTDATLEFANFEGANLKNVDFSRSNLKGVNFMDANLSGADFENCNLTGADFTRAKFSTARFPGAILKNVKY